MSVNRLRDLTCMLMEAGASAELTKIPQWQ
jgi:hypothetical protein